jgi:hypothetical protein
VANQDKRFAKLVDNPLKRKRCVSRVTEGDGFEPSVPRKRDPLFKSAHQWQRAVHNELCDRRNGSGPVPAILWPSQLMLMPVPECAAAEIVEWWTRESAPCNDGHAYQIVPLFERAVVGTGRADDIFDPPAWARRQQMHGQ